MTGKSKQNATKRARELAVFKKAFPEIPESEIVQPDQEGRADIEYGRIGIELTRLHVDTGKDAKRGSKLRAAEGREDKLLQKVRLIAECSDIPPSHVKVLFGHHHDKSLECHAPVLCAIIQKNMPPEGKSISLNWADDQLPLEIVRINISRHKSLTCFTVAPTRAGFVLTLTPDHVKERIAAKEAKAVSTYPERWLLLDINGFAPSSLIEIGDEAGDYVYETIFDRVLVIECFGGRLVKLKTKPATPT